MSTTTLHYATSKDGTTIAFDRLGTGPPSSSSVAARSIDRPTPAWRTSWPRTSPSSTSIAAAAATAATRCRTPSSARSRTSRPSSRRLAGRPGCRARRPGPPWRCSRPPAGASVSKLALWEPPYIIDPAARPPADQVEQYETMVAEGRRGDAAEYFMAKVVGMPPDFVAYAKSQPWWADQEALAHTLAYDARIMGDYSRAGGQGGQGDRADARSRRLCEHALHGLRRRCSGRGAAARLSAGPSPTRDTTSMPPSWRPCWPSSSAS